MREARLTLFQLLGSGTFQRNGAFPPKSGITRENSGHSHPLGHKVDSLGAIFRALSVQALRRRFRVSIL